MIEDDDEAKIRAKDDALVRAHHWIVDLKGGGHGWACRGSEILPPEIRQSCNCGRDALLLAISKATAAGPPTNGGGSL